MAPKPEPFDPDRIARTRTIALQHASRKIEDFTHVEWRAVVSDLATHSEKGLSADEAAQRLARHGPNELTKEPPTPFWKLFLEQFTDLLVILLIIACIVSMFLKEFEAGSFILIIVIINAVLGSVVEYSASDSLDQLEKMSADKATVIRDGIQVDVPANSLVPGDVVVLINGCKCPADVRLISSEELSTEEAALTGEAAEVKKDAEHVIDSTNESGGEEGKLLSAPNMCYMACSITSGHGKGVVVKTGMQTAVGAIAQILSNTEAGDSPLQQRLEKLGMQLGISAICASLLLFGVCAITGRGSSNTGTKFYSDIVLIALSLVVAAVPEGLPAAVTITLALGMRRLVKKGALIKYLKSVETLGSATVICSDKTGTLTRGQMTAVRMWYDGKIWKITGTGYDTVGSLIPIDKFGVESEEALNDKAHYRLITAAMLASNAVIQLNEHGIQEVVGNSSEKPLVVLGAKVGLKTDDLNLRYRRTKENPFNSKRKMMSVVVSNPPRDSVFEQGCDHVAVVKGAPNIILGLCHSIVGSDGTNRRLTDSDREQILKQIDDFSEQALRVLAFAYKLHDSPEGSPEELESDLILMGLIASIDPERTEVIPSIKQCYDAGIRVVMITGDYEKTARAIAVNIGLISRDALKEASIDCEILQKYGVELADIKNRLKISEVSGTDKLDLLARQSELQSNVDAITCTADVYARAKPVDKITIIESLQRQGNICSMTGDGVNDAPALKQANIGVAMGITGTDVAKGAASMILTNDDFVSIVRAVEEGRTMYNNIQKFIFYLLSTNVGEVFLVLIATLIGYESPLVPTQILYLNLVTDGFPALALAVEPTEAEVMQEGPRSVNEPMLIPLLLAGILIHASVLTGLNLIVYIVGLYWNAGTANPSHFHPKSVYYQAHKKTIDDGVDIAQTMNIIFIVFAELFRAYTCRSLRNSVITIGPFKNKWIFLSIFSAVGLTLVIYLTPGVNSALDLVSVPAQSWALILILSVVPAIIDELVKVVYRAVGFGSRIKPLRSGNWDVAHATSTSVVPQVPPGRFTAI